MKISITIKQLDDMKHTIGYKRGKVKVKSGKYTAYRNYFTTPAVDESWEDLCKKGYAASGKGGNYTAYHVTEKGFELLEKMLDIKIIQE